jgi:aminomethyltransferase
VSLTVHDDRSLLAVQGPAGVKAVQALSKDDFSKLYFSYFTRTELKGIPVWITRTG